MRRRLAKSRGSVLVMVVGILTIVAMLGTSFLVIARSDARQTRDLAAKAQADPIAAGLALRVQELIRQDLPIGPQGPYSGMGNGPAAWYSYVDAPDAAVDPWLASPWTDGTDLMNEYSPSPDGLIWPVWRHLSNALADPNTAAYENIPSSSSSLVDADRDQGDPPSAAQPWLWTLDARLVPLGVYDPQGTEFYGAIRVIDTSGLMNLNMAGDRAEPLNPRTVANIRLKETFAQWRLVDNTTATGLYTALHEARCGMPAQTLDQMMAGMGIRPLSPTSQFMPFGIADEMFLRCPEQYPSLTRSGRLFRIIETLRDDTTDYMRRLRRISTVWSSSRNTLRSGTNPAGKRTAMMLSDLVAAGQTGENARQWLYAKLAEAVGGASAPEDIRKEIAHFIANAWAFMSPSDATQAFAFQPSGESFTVYGVVEQLVITDAYAYYLPPSTEGGADGGYAYAIELFNPTNLAISLADYRVNGQSLSGAPAAINPGGRLLIRNFGGYYRTATGRVLANGSNSDHRLGTSPRVDLPALDFAARDAVLTRELNSGTDVIAIDRVSGADFGFPAQLPTSGDTAIACHGLRDDDLARQRATVAVMARTNSTAVVSAWARWNTTNHNTSGGADLTVPGIGTVPNVYEGFGIGTTTALGGTLWGLPHAVPASMGDLVSVFKVGPEKGNFNSGLPNALAAGYVTNMFRGKLDFWQSPTASGGAYPDVPWAALVFEMLEQLPPDPTRGPDAHYYGRINVNTAPREVLRRLPWSTTIIPWNNPEDGVVKLLASHIAAYRDKCFSIHQNTPYKRDYRNRSTGVGMAGVGVPGLRANSDVYGYMTPGEVFAPVADYAAYNYTTKLLEHRVRNTPVRFAMLAGSVGNLLTVNSDTFAAYIHLQSGMAKPKYKWGYLAVFDRSNCVSAGDMPSVLLFTEIPTPPSKLTPPGP